jgi:LysM repeat protein
MENATMKKILQLMIVLMILFTSFASTSGASAWSGCPSYITVQWGDTLSGIAKQCGVTAAAIQDANPGLGWWVYAGQVLYIPKGYVPAPSYGGTYVVQQGDTLGKIAARLGCSVSSILAVNQQIHNASVIYVGQVINLPAGVVPPPPPVYTPPPTDCTCCNCQPPSSPIDSYSTLKIDYAHGLFVRAEPNGRIIASGRDKGEWLYDPASLYTDSKGKVWVKVHLYPAVKGYTSGWMLVRDQLGKYFTKPALP